MDGLVIRAGVALLVVLVLLSPANPATGQGIAAKYVRDVGIANDPDVILTEMYEDRIAAIASRWNQVQNSAGMSLSSDVPSASGGAWSLLITSVSAERTRAGTFSRTSPRGTTKSTCGTTSNIRHRA